MRQFSDGLAILAGAGCCWLGTLLARADEVIVTSRYRLQALPNVPTVEESGVPGFETTAWLGVMGPAGLPPTIRQKCRTPSES
jgi:hypothetical protein